MRFPKHSHLIAVLLLSAALLVLAAARANVFEWDEARVGASAFEMLHNGDYINLYYAGQPDTWSAKPPLMVWLIMLSYKAIGFNVLAMRLPAIISTAAFMLVFYQLIETYSGRRKALLTCLVLLSCKAIFGIHTGFTADYDSLLTLFLSLSVVSYMRFIENGEKNGAILAAIFTGLAFYTKGPAAFIFIPGLILYALVRKKISFAVRNPATWLGILVLLLIAGSWIFMVYQFGIQTADSHYGTGNAIETMLIHETFMRLTSTSFEPTHVYDPDPLFFFHVLDARMNLWNYVFYLAVVTGIYTLLRNRIRDVSSHAASHKLVAMSLCLILPLAVVLTAARNKHDWYFMPVFGFCAYLVAEAIVYWQQRWRYTALVFSALFLFCFGRHVWYLATLPNELTREFRKNSNLSGRFLVVTQTPQEMVLYFKWRDIGFVRTTDAAIIDNYPGSLILAHQNDTAKVKIKPVKCFDKYCLGTAAPVR
jgi:4-amino-4-deoxy-L-arabinose transferase-like glycosyltransferase